MAFIKKIGPEAGPAPDEAAASSGLSVKLGPADAAAAPISFSAADAQHLARIVVTLFGETALQQARTSSLFRAPYLGDARSLEDWVQKALDTAFPPEVQAGAYAHVLQHHLLPLQALRQGAAAATPPAAAAQELEQALADNRKLRQQLQASLGVDWVIDTALAELPHRFRNGLRELCEVPDPNLSRFVFFLGLRWPAVQRALQDPNADEEGRVQQLQEACRPLWADIAELSFAARKPLLHDFADMLSNAFDHFILTSPEDMRHVDPALHNPVQGGGEKIKVGCSFIVLRRANNMLFMHGDVVVEP